MGKRGEGAGEMVGVVCVCVCEREQGRGWWMLAIHETMSYCLATSDRLKTGKWMVRGGRGEDWGGLGRSGEEWGGVGWEVRIGFGA